MNVVNIAKGDWKLRIEAPNGDYAEQFVVPSIVPNVLLIDQLRDAAGEAFEDLQLAAKRFRAPRPEKGETIENFLARLASDFERWANTR